MGYMDKIWEAGILPLIIGLHKNVYLQAVRQAFFLLIPFIVAVSALDVLDSLLLNPVGPVLGSSGLNLGFWLTGGLSGDAYRQSFLAEAFYSCRYLVNMGYLAITLLLTLSLADRLALIWGGERRLTMFAALMSMVIFLPLPTESPLGTLDHFGERRYLLSFAAAFGAARVFTWLQSKKFLRLKTPACFPKMLGFYLGHLSALLLTIGVFSLLAMIRYLIPFSLENFWTDFLSGSIWQQPLAALAYQSIVWFLWWCGIPGYAFTADLGELAYGQAAAGKIFSDNFFEMSLMHVVALSLAILVFSRHNSWRRGTLFCLPCTLFNIQAPLVYGLPVVLNPIFFIPYILAPLANTFVGWAAVSWGIVPPMQAEVPWTMPIFLAGILGTHSVMGAVLQGVWLIMDIFIYAPFVIMANMVDFPKELEEEDHAET